jgi:hypothetical protein
LDLEDQEGADSSFSILAVNDEYSVEHLNALSALIVYVSFQILFRVVKLTSRFYRMKLQIQKRFIELPLL